jgi:hypothetical protein
MAEEGRSRNAPINATRSGEDLMFMRAGIFTLKWKRHGRREKKAMPKPYRTREEKSTSFDL